MGHDGNQVRRPGRRRAGLPGPSRIPLGRVTMAEIVDGTWFLLTNTGVDAIDLAVDGGYTTT